jgi:glycosyltransferase involved in cell wall biosynthesis
VVYQPKAAATHYEFGSTSPEASMELQLARRPIFVSTHRRWLASQMSNLDAGSKLAARSHPHWAQSVLLIDDAVPDPRSGSGFPRAAALLQALVELDYRVTLYTTNGGDAGRPHLDLPNVEVLPGHPTGLQKFLSTGRPHQMVIVSRPHNMQYVKAAIGSDLSGLGVPCIYDAEAIYALREIGRRRLIGQPMSEEDSDALIAAEIRLARGCKAILTVSEPERGLFAAAARHDPLLTAAVHVVAHAVERRATANRFESRRSILFVGAFSSQSSNEDSVLHLCRDVMPAIRTEHRLAPPVVVAGADIPEHLKSVADPAVTWQSNVVDLAPLYEDARVFVAPARYSAGISLKVIEAAARGVPIVCSRLIADQLGWRSGTELLAADGALESARAIASLYEDGTLWTRLRDGALHRVARDYSISGFRLAVQDSLRRVAGDEAGSGPSRPRSLRTAAAAAD